MIIGKGTALNVVYLDLDDFCESNARWSSLVSLRATIPHFKVNLFTIPARCSKNFLRDIFDNHSDWVDLIPHGWEHNSNYECKFWSRSRMQEAIRCYQDLGFTTKGFKAPGWQISHGCYEALQEAGYWVADQPYNNTRRPPGLKAYLLDAPFKLHGHIGHLGGHNPNELELIYDDICRHRSQLFGFIRSYMDPSQQTTIGQARACQQPTI